MISPPVRVSISNMATTAGHSAVLPEIYLWGKLRGAGHFEQPFVQELTPPQSPVELRMLAEATFSGLRLRHPIVITVQWDEAQCLVTTSLVDTYGASETEEDAIADFLSSLAVDYGWLLENRDALAPRLARQLYELTNLLCPVAD